MIIQEIHNDITTLYRNNQITQTAFLEGTQILTAITSFKWKTKMMLEELYLQLHAVIVLDAYKTREVLLLSNKLGKFSPSFLPM